MAQARTRAQMRDDIRRNLNKEVAKDRNPSAADGDPSTVDPAPTNAQLDKALREAISFISVETGFSEANPVEVEVAAQTADGAYAINLRSLSVPVNEVRRVSWDNGSTRERLKPLQRDELDNTRRQWENDTVGVPQWFWIEGYKLYLLPSPSSAGTLSIIAGTGIIGFETDNDVIEQLPNDYHPTASDCATWFYADTQQNDSEMAGYAKTFSAKALRGIQNILKFRQKVNKQHQGTFAPRNRHYRGRGR